MSVGIEVAVVDYLATVTAVTDITSRIRVDHAIPSDNPPYVVVTVTSEEPLESLGGSTGDIYTTIDVMCVAESKTTVRNLEWATRHGVITQTGTNAGLQDWSGTQSGFTIYETEWQGTASSIDEPDDGSEKPLYLMTGTYRINNDSPS